MSTQAQRLILAGVLLLLAAGVGAQGLGVPPGKWWERPKVVAELALTAEQTQKLEAVTFESAKVMIDLKAAVDKAELELRMAAEAEPLDMVRARETFTALQQARMRLEGERFEALLKIRRVLKVEQWQQLREMTKERLRERLQDREPGGLPPVGGKRPIRRWNN